MSGFYLAAVLYVLGIPMACDSLEANKLPRSHGIFWPLVGLVYVAAFIGSGTIEAWDRIRGRHK